MPSKFSALFAGSVWRKYIVSLDKNLVALEEKMAMKSDYNFLTFFRKCRINAEQNSEKLMKISHKEKKYLLKTSREAIKLNSHSYSMLV